MKKGFRILKFKKDNPIFEVKDISKSFDGRPVLKKLSLKTNLIKYFLMMILVTQLMKMISSTMKINLVD